MHAAALLVLVVLPLAAWALRDDQSSVLGDVLAFESERLQLRGVKCFGKHCACSAPKLPPTIKCINYTRGDPALNWGCFAELPTHVAFDAFTVKCGDYVPPSTPAAAHDCVLEYDLIDIRTENGPHFVGAGIHNVMCTVDPTYKKVIAARDVIIHETLASDRGKTVVFAPERPMLAANFDVQSALRAAKAEQLHLEKIAANTWESRAWWWFKTITLCALGVIFAEAIRIDWEHTEHLINHAIDSLQLPDVSSINTPCDPPTSRSARRRAAKASAQRKAAIAKIQSAAENAKPPPADEVPEAIACTICIERKLDVRLKCGHLFCLACVSQLLDPSCPRCRLPIDERDIKPVFI